jgi:hypothetical protein
MNAILLPIAADGALYAAVAATLALTSREFGLYNLASGAWLVLGGWIVQSWVGLQPGHGAILNPWVLLFFLPLAALQIMSPLILRARLRGNVLSYLFVTLGGALVVTNVAPTWLLSSSGMTIPLQRSMHAVLVFFICCCASALLVLVVFRSQLWARLVISFRVAGNHNQLWAGLSFLIGLELFLLIALGAAGFFVHKGVFGSAEYRTVIPILALVASRSRPVVASVLSLVVVVASHIIIAASPNISGLVLSPYARATAILLLLLVVLVRALPRRPLDSAQRITSVPPRVSTKFLSERGGRQLILGGITIVVLAAVSVIAWRLRPYLLAEEDFHRAVFVSVLALTSWVAQRHLGISTITWPAIGVLPVFLYAVSASVMSVCIIVGLILFHLWSLRVLRHEAALLIDLAALVSLHQIVKTSPSLSGDNEILFFHGRSAIGVSNGTLLILQICLSLGLLAFVLGSACLPRLRAISLGLSNLRLGLHHGIAVRRIFLLGISSLAAIAMLATASFHAISESVTVSELSLENGLLVFLLGYFFLRRGPILPITFIFAIYVICGSLLSGHGVMFRVVLGLAFMTLPFFLRYGEETHEYPGAEKRVSTLESNPVGERL